MLAGFQASSANIGCNQVSAVSETRPTVDGGWHEIEGCQDEFHTGELHVTSCEQGTPYIYINDVLNINEFVNFNSEH